MTVCIAAISRGEYIVTASDLMISTYDSSLDGSTIKVQPIHEHWAAMMAADDFTQCIPIIELAARYLLGRANTLQVTRTAFKRAYQNHLKEVIEDRVLSRFGMDMETFCKSGKRRFTDAKFNKLFEQIDDVSIGCQFLVYGFDGKRNPHLFIVDEPGKDGVHDKPGFCTIGSGCYAASGIMMALGQKVDCDLETTIFNVCAAKFAAEKTQGVGRETYLFAKRYGTNLFFTERPEELLKKVRWFWEKHGAPKIPGAAIAMLKDRQFHFPNVVTSSGEPCEESAVRSS